MKDDAKASKKDPEPTTNRINHDVHVADLALTTNVVTNTTAHTLTEIQTLTLTIHRIAHLWSDVKKSHVCIVQRAAPTTGTRTTHPALHRPSDWGQTTWTPEHLTKVLKPVNNRFTNVLTFQFYRLINRDQRYEDYVAKRIAKTAKHMEVQMRHNMLDRAEQIFVLKFL